MYENIFQLTKMVYEVIAEEKNKKVILKVYDCYRRLCDTNHAIDVLLFHYLHLTLNEPFLVNTTSYKSPLHKWISTTNEDFDRVTECIKELLLSLHRIPSNSENSSCVFKGEDEMFYACVYYHYLAGRISEDGTKITQITASENYRRKPRYIEETIDIPTLEDRLLLKEQTNVVLEQMFELQNSFKEYLLEYAAIEDLVQNPNMRCR